MKTQTLIDSVFREGQKLKRGTITGGKNGRESGIDGNRGTNVFNEDHDPD